MAKPKPIVDLKRDALGHYRPGNPPGPGRPKGSKTLFSKAWLQDVHELWEEGGKEAVRTAMRKQPASYFRSMVILHKPTLHDLDASETTGFEHMQTAEEVIEAVRIELGDEVADAMAKSIGIKLPKVIESTKLIAIERRPEGKKVRPLRLRPKRK